MKINIKDYLTHKTVSNILVIFSGILLYFLILKFDAVWSSLKWFLSIFKPFIWGFIIAYLINFFVKFFENKVFKKIKKPKTQRVLSMLTSYFLAIIILGLILFMLVPQTIESISILMNNVPNYVENLIRTIDQFSVRYGWQENLRDWANNTLLYIENLAPNIISAIVPYTMDITAKLSQWLLNIFIAVVVSIYLLGTKEKYCAQIKKLLYAHLKEERLKNLIGFVNLMGTTFENFLSGKLIDSLIIGVICFAALSLLKFPFPLLVSVIVAITNIIPFFGPIIGAVPTFFIILIANPIKALWYPLFILILQQIDGNIIGPRILGISIGISALWIVFAIVIGGKLFGFVGMVIGVPLFAIIYTILKANTEKRLKNKGLPEETEAYTNEKDKIRF